MKDHSVKNRTEHFIRKNKNKKKIAALAAVMGAVVTVGTVYSVTNQGHAKTYTVKELTCSYKNHEHTAACYDSEGKLICGYADYTVHVHNDDCYDENGVLVCTLPEIPEHKHTDACYTIQEKLTCGLEENPGHIHTDECYQTVGGELICTSEDPDHVHTEECYAPVEKVLVCTIPEGEGAHTHTAACYTQEKVLTCGKLELHTHTAECYERNPDGSLIQPNADGTFTGTLICDTPELKEHIHSDDCFTEREMTAEEISGEEEIKEEQAVEAEEAETAEDTEAAEETAKDTETAEEVKDLVQTAETENYVITATYSKAAEIPAEAVFQAKEITEENDPEAFALHLEQLKATYGADYQVNFMIDSGFYVDGVEMEPAEPVDIQITAKDGSMLPDDKITHFKETEDKVILETLEAQVEDGSLVYTQDSFSITVSGSNSGASMLGISGGTTVEVGKTLNLTGTTGYYHSWSSSSNSIASVSGSGTSATVTGKKEGTVTITHTYYDYSFYQWGKYTETIVINVIAVPVNYTVKFYANTGNTGGTSSTLVKTLTLSVDKNGTTVTVPISEVADPNPSTYTSGGIGYQFYGWSKSNSANTSDSAFVYHEDTTFSINDFTNKTLNLYGTWGQTSYQNATYNKLMYYICLEGVIFNEPSGYSSSLFTDSVGDGKFNNNSVYYLRHIYNDRDALYANIKDEPTAAQIVTAINAKSSKMGGLQVKEQNGAVIVSHTSTFAEYRDFAVGDELYVEWYVMKFAGNGWHIDGALRNRAKWNLKYDKNCPEVVEKIIPNIQYNLSESATVHNTTRSGSDLTQTNTVPVRTGYEFLGWNTMADGSGTWYNAGDSIGPGQADETITLYAQWSRGTNKLTVTKCNTEGTILQGAQFKLESKQDADSPWVQEKTFTTNASGKFEFANLENITIYRLTEAYAPLGNEIRQSFCFRVTVDEGQNLLGFYLTDENGTPLPESQKPDWVSAEYTQIASLLQIRMTIEDQAIEQDVTFIKADDEGNRLAGAVFELYKKNTAGQYVKVENVLKTSDENGIFSVEDLKLTYGEYKLVEVTAPNGYELGGDVLFRISDPVAGNATAGLTILSDAEQSSAAAEEETTVDTSLNAAGDPITTTTYSYTMTVKDEPQYTYHRS